jgi:crotonobetainyl-CoA:carnitine CoA-transferase CaiB-like acyl-CoA transferase
VLDLTRVLAGPVSTRFLAGYGADVLRIDPLDWDEPGIVPEVTLGKHCARLDLHQPDDRSVFERLLSEADVLVHGYRAGALDTLGYGERQRRAIKSDLIDVSLNAYGWSGPWKERRGFDSLVQMSSGIAAAGMAWKQADRPIPLPVQALDQATGYLMAAAVIRGLIGRLQSEGAITARLSLARTASLLIEMRDDQPASAWRQATHDDYSPTIEETEWGPAKRVRAPAVIETVPMQWDRPASSLGSCEPRWST